MKRAQRGEIRYFAFLTAFVCSMFFTGCGSSSDGGGNPAGLLPPDTIRGGVEGYVSRSSLPANIKARVGASLTCPFADTTVTLSTFDGKSGNEVILGQSQTDDRGYYQISYAFTDHPTRNLIIRAIKGAETCESVLPMLKPGIIVRAETLTPGRSFEAQLVHELRKLGKSQDINIGELTSMLSGESLSLLGQGITSIANALAARDEARRLKFGDRFDALVMAAFEIELDVAEAVENGEMSSEDGRGVFIRRLEERARLLGFTSEELSALDDYDDAFIFRPLKKMIPGASDGGEIEDGIETARLRENKRNSLSLIADAVTILVGEKSRTEFAGLYQLIEKMREQLDAVSSPADIRALFSPDSTRMVELSNLLNSVLNSLRFTPDLIAEVFTMEPPSLIESAAANGLTKIASPGRAESMDPAGLVRQQDRIMTDLTEAVRHVAEKASLALPDDKLKAIALLLWATSHDKLDIKVQLPDTSGNTAEGESAPGDA
ncbi:MAG TPA: hypothetical protein PLY73_16205, partial [Candidatus Ozemobacteraceae bacterium]|nr:hypothetical protein [Candidatus Ozemobacteraceae bacterium]